MEGLISATECHQQKNDEGQSGCAERGVVYKMKRTGSKVDPCGTPQLMGTGAELQLFTITV